jgi:hypothetical protein
MVAGPNPAEDSHFDYYVRKWESAYTHYLHNRFGWRLLFVTAFGLGVLVETSRITDTLKATSVTLP